MNRKIFINLAILGLFFVLLTFIPDLLKRGREGFGYVQWFLLRNGIFFLVTGTIPLLFPGTIDYFKRIFNDDKYEPERAKYFKDYSLFSKYDFVLLILFLIAANLFTVYFLGKEKYIYTWDEAHFWSRYIQLNREFKEGLLRGLISTLGSIQYLEYNQLSSFFLMPFSMLFGTERLPYILSLVNIYVLFSAISFILLYRRFAGTMFGNTPPYWGVVIAFFTFFFFPFLWIPILYGYIGIGGFFIMSLILFYYFKYPFHIQKYRTLVVIGILLSILVLFRRWYSFWAISFFIALIINESIFLLAERQLDRDRVTVLARKISFLILTTGFVFLMIAAPRVIKILTTDYSYLLAYATPDSVLIPFKKFVRQFGIFYISLSLAGFFISFYYKETRKFASFLIIHLITIFLTFAKVQNFLFHHYYLLQPTILLFIALLISTILSKIKSRALQISVCGVYILVSTIIFSTVFFPGASSFANIAKELFPRVRCYPYVRKDLDEIRKILYTLNTLLTNPEDRVYVLSSSLLLNSDVLYFAELSIEGTPKIGEHIFRSSDVDLKDGFPSKLFKAKYVVIADPIQYDLGERKQRVIGIPAEAILKKQDMGKSYRKLPYEFTLEGGVKVYIYERIGDYNQADVEFLSNALRKYYPDKPFVYEPQ
jgi:hypothetical protein